MSLSVRSISDNYIPGSQILNNQESNQEILPRLPPEMLYDVFNYLGPRDLISLGSTCKTLLPVSLLDSLWKGIVARQCGQDYVDFLESTRFAKKELTTAETSPKTSEEISEESSNKILRESSEEISQDTSMETSVEMKIPEIFKCAMAGYWGVMRRKLSPNYQVDSEAEKRFCEKRLTGVICNIISSEKINTFYYLLGFGSNIFGSSYCWKSYVDNEKSDRHTLLFEPGDDQQVFFNKNQINEAVLISCLNPEIYKLKFHPYDYIKEPLAVAEIDINARDKFKNINAMFLRNGDMLTIAIDAQNNNCALLLYHANHKMIPGKSEFQIEKIADYPSDENFQFSNFIGELANRNVLIQRADEFFVIFNLTTGLSTDFHLNGFYGNNMIILADGNIGYIKMVYHIGGDRRGSVSEFFFCVINPENGQEIKNWPINSKNEEIPLRQMNVIELRNRNIIITFDSTNAIIFDQNGKVLQDIRGNVLRECTETIQEDIIFYSHTESNIRWLKNLST